MGVRFEVSTAPAPIVGGFAGDPTVSGPMIVDTATNKVAIFHLVETAQQTAKRLNAHPGLAPLFHWLQAG